MSDEPKPTKTIGEIANEAGLSLWSSYCDLKMQLEATRDHLAGGDGSSLPDDYPTWQMARDRMEDLAKARAEIELLRKANAEYQLQFCDLLLEINRLRVLEEKLK